MTINIAILGSTQGTDVEYIMNAKKNRKLNNIHFKFILSNKQNAGILNKANKWNIPSIWLSNKNKNKDEYDNEINILLEKYKIDLVLLIGYMKLMSNNFVKKWYGRIMNIHPSLLPAFSGQMNLNVHQAVLDRGCKITGATLIFIDEGVDTGPIISQKIVHIDNNETVETLKKKVQIIEGELLIEALQLWRDNKIKLFDNKVILLKEHNILM